MQDAITALILTFNEAPNIGRTLQQLTWANQILIIDSFSTDNTIDLVRSITPQAIVQQRVFESFADQCNFGLSQITTEWVLSLDADYLLTPELVAEIAALQPSSDVAGYRAEFRYCIFGRPLRSTVYPARTVLYRRQLARYRNEGHGHRVVVGGRIKMLSSKIDHDDRKPFGHWLHSQNKYSKIEAKHLLAQSLETLSAPDRLRRRIFFAAPAMFLYLLFARRLILDGWPGWFYVCQRTIAETLLSVRLLLGREKLEAND
jgi:glycosyltransferase involved in cell wall biosynthesis